MRVSCSPSNRQTSTFVALAENSAKFVPLPLQCAPSGYGSPSSTGPAMICPRFLRDNPRRTEPREVQNVAPLVGDFSSRFYGQPSDSRVPGAMQRVALREALLRRTGTAQSAGAGDGPGSAERHEECRIASGTRLSPSPLIQR